MDDIRRPYHPQRGDYTSGLDTPHRPPDRIQPKRPVSASSHPKYQSAQNPHQAPVHQQAPYAADVLQTAHPHTQSRAPHQQNQPVYHRPPVKQPVNAQPAPPKTKGKPGLKLFTALVCLAVGGLLVAAGYAFKSSEDPKTLPAQVTSRADYSVYFPSPMPDGYTYMKDTATFQIGQVFYKFSNGLKRVTVKEEPAPNPAPNLSLLAGYNQFDAPVGKAAVGTSAFGQPTAVVVTPTTVITLNGTGGVTGDELMTAIKNLKNIGRSSERKT